MLISTACVVTSAEPKPTHKSRVVDRQLSGEKHYDGDEHNAEYDHDAFVGQEEAKTFDELTPEESQKRLGLLFLKIDKDGDNRVSPAELQSWMRHVQQESMDTETDRQWSEFRRKDPDFLAWDEYVQHTYKDNKDDDLHPEEQAKETANDERRWKLADRNEDGVLSKDEFSNLIHPEEAPHMRESLIQETLDEVDKNNDGMISLNEYLNDLANDDDDDDDDDGDNEMGWTAEDEEEFRTEMDKDGDGKLNRDEIYQWLVPEDFDHIVDESNHLFAEADGDQDGFLSGQEMIDKHDVFVGSQATDYGSVLKRQEL